MPALSSYTEDDLLRLLAADDRNAFAEIYNRYWQFLLGMAYHRIKDWQAAEDIVHDVFASLWLNRQKTEIKSLKNYLAVAVKYMILKEVRKAVLRKTYQQRIIPSPLYVAASDTAFDNRRIIEIVQKEIASLPEKCRLIFSFSREKGMTVKEIAGQLNISPKTVENQLNKALRRLRGSIKDTTVLLGYFLFF